MSGERRKAFRKRSQPGKDSAALRIGSQKVAVHIVDDSASGIAMICKEVHDVARGDLAHLECGDDEAKIRVSRVERHDDGMLICVERVFEDGGDDPVEVIHCSWYEVLFSSYSQSGSAGGAGGGSSVGVIGMIGVGLLVIVCIASLVMNYSPSGKGSMGARSRTVARVAERFESLFKRDSRPAAARARRSFSIRRTWNNATAYVSDLFTWGDDSPATVGIPAGQPAATGGATSAKGAGTAAKGAVASSK